MNYNKKFLLDIIGRHHCHAIYREYDDKNNSQREYFVEFNHEKKVDPYHIHNNKDNGEKKQETNNNMIKSR